ncbi:MAG: FMN-binding negative transcriptional regulator [Arenimonas sp.]
MYTPGYFAETDLAQLDRLALEYPFATLITIAGGEPYVSHLPILYQREDSQISIRGHWSRANPQWRHAGEATLILHGPDAYVSPSWYPDKESAARVPTWNYAVAHLTGVLEIIEDEAGLAAIVGDLTLTHEAQVGSDWRFDLTREDLRSQLRGIVGFRLRPRAVEVKFKLSQNHPEANVRSVAAQLAQGEASAVAVAALMLERLSVVADGSGR